MPHARLDKSWPPRRPPILLHERAKHGRLAQDVIMAKPAALGPFMTRENIDRLHRLAESPSAQGQKLACRAVAQALMSTSTSGS